MFESNKDKFSILFIFLLINSIIFDSIHSYESEYYEGYNDGYHDSQHGLDNKFRRLRTHMRYHNRNRYKPYRGSNYDDQDEHNFHLSGLVKGGVRTNFHNYANLFSFNEDQLKKKAQKLSENCRNNVRPDAAKCVEKAANKWKANIRTERLQSNECMALWSIVCCALDLSSKRCTHEDFKILEEGFYGIQEILESKDCSDNPRSSVKCDEL